MKNKLKIYLKKLVNKYNSYKVRGILLKKKKALKYLYKFTIFLPKYINITERVFCILNNIERRSICKNDNCNNNVVFSSGKYLVYCCKKCADTCNHKVKKAKKSCIEKYGVDSPSKNKEIREKQKKTCLKKYGVTTPFKNKEIKDKIKQTCLEKYGVEVPSKSEEAKENQRQTCLNRYGVDNPSKVKKFNEKRNKTFEKIYGNHPFSTEEIKEKRKKTFLEKYKVEYLSQNKEIQDNFIRKHYENFYNIFLDRLKVKNLELISNKETYVDRYSKIEIRCIKCKKEFETTYRNYQKIYCKKCCNKISKQEHEVSNFLNSINISHERNKFFIKDGKKYEADIFIENYKLIIEMNGEYWHSDAYKDKSYHTNKTLFFNNLGYDIIHIFESEWLNKNDIIKSLIKNKVKLNKTVYVIKCQIKEVNSKEYKKFLIKNHIQGYLPSKYKIGLYYEGTLSSVIGLGNYRFEKNKSELLRYCTIKNYNIVGGFSKLLKYFLKNYNYTSIVTYCDIRFFNGKDYLKNNFKLIKKTNPSYYYFKNYILENRIDFQKYKLKDILDDYDKNLTKHENMINNKYIRVWDCGNYKFEYKEIL